MKACPLIDFFPKAFAKSLRVKANKLSLAEKARRELIAATVLVAAERLVKKKYVGMPADVEDIIAEVASQALRRAYKWQPGGPKTLEQFSYGSCNWAFIDLMRIRQKTDREDALDHIDPAMWKFSKGVRDSQDDTWDKPAERLTDEVCDRDEPEFNDEENDE